MADNSRIVRTPDGQSPYKVVFEPEHLAAGEFPVETMREGEALIREKSPIAERALPAAEPWLGPIRRRERD